MDNTLRKLWDNFATTFGQIWDIFWDPLRQFWYIVLDNFAIQATALIKGTFSNHLDTNWAWQHGQQLGIIWWPLRFPFLVFSKLVPTQWGGAYLCPVGSIWPLWIWHTSFSCVILLWDQWTGVNMKQNLTMRCCCHPLIKTPPWPWEIPYVRL